MTPLHAAVESGNILMIHYLLGSAFDANVVPVSTCHSGRKPLMSAFLTARASPHQDGAGEPVASVIGGSYVSFSSLSGLHILWL